MTLDPSESSPDTLFTADALLALPLQRLRRQRLILAVCISAAVLVGLLRAHQPVALYQASARIQLQRGLTNAFKVEPAETYDSDVYPTEQTVAALLRSPTLLGQVVDDLHLSLDPAAIGAGLDIQPIPSTDLIRLSMANPDPELAAALLNRLILDFSRRNAELRLESARRNGHWITGQLSELEQQVRREQVQVVALQSMPNPAATNPIPATLNRLQAQAREDSLLRAPDAPDLQLASLRMALAKARAAQAQSAATLGPNHPESRVAQTRIDQLTAEVEARRQRMVVEAHLQLVLAREIEARLRSQLALDRATLAGRSRDAVQASLLEHDLAGNQRRLDQLTRARRSAELDPGLNALETDVIDPATVPTVPLPRPYLVLAVRYAGYGLAVGLLLILIPGRRRESLDDLSRLTGLPVLATIPVTTRAHFTAQFNHALRALWRTLLLSPPGTILLTSAQPTAGTTTLAASLAVMLAERGARTLLIDANLESPTLHHWFNRPGRLGLGSILRHEASAEDVLQTLPQHPNLSLLAAGPIPGNPAELLDDDAIHDLLKRLAGQFDQILIDAPSLVTTSSTVLFARHAAMVLVVARHGSIDLRQLRHATQLLARAGVRLAGLVLNAVDPKLVVDESYAPFNAPRQTMERDRTPAQSLEQS